MYPISSQDEIWFPVFDWRFEPTFHKHLKWSFHSAICRWEGLCAFCLKWNVPREAWLKKGQISLQWLKFRLVFHVTRWRDVWIPCGDPRQRRSSPPHLDNGNHISLIPREAHVHQGFKIDEAWLFLKIDRNTKIFLETRKGHVVSHLTSEASLLSFQA